MPRICYTPRTSHRQAGAALVIALLLLVVLTLLAISGVNSSSLNLVMAGNTQFAQNAFQAAESGIERSLQFNEFNPDPSLPPETKTDTKPKFTAVSNLQLCGMAQPALPGSSQDDYSTYHFEVESTGGSERSASSVNIQGIAILVKKADSVGALENCPASGGAADTRI